ncbi:hypothetical protein L1987_37222 [Smallanthus sonchifolius]|uniref:Uncharacterized protein n=1 Tax=Smallanthus sonchifolius TaxID=185202 RepID=A0ACB9HH47_9ASTR|nr:hypothetical protein L1987_37222 [Smallanthus sonchifolius]
MPFVGTSYLIDGCDDTEECARCEGDQGYCDYISIYDVDGLAKEWNFTCRYNPDNTYNGSLFTALTIAIIVGVSLTSFLVGDEITMLAYDESTSPFLSFCD